jgi:uncharacterized protein YoxC
MTWLEISAVVVTLVILVCAYYLVRALIAVKASLVQVNLTMKLMQITLEETAEPAKQLMVSSTRLTEEIQEKIQTLQGLFQSMNEAKEAVGDAATTIRKASTVVSQSVTSAQKAAQAHQKRLQDGLEWATTGIELWHRWQAYKQTKMEFGKNDSV